MLVIGGGGASLTALGDLAVLMASMRGAAGVVVHARERDLEDIDPMGLPVFGVAAGITSMPGHARLVAVAIGAFLQHLETERGTRPTTRQHPRRRVPASFGEEPRLQQPGQARGIDTEARWHQARRLLHDQSIKAEDRVAGLLVLLYAQWAAAISRLTLDHVHADAREVRLRLGRELIAVAASLGRFAHMLSELGSASVSRNRMETSPDPCLECSRARRCRRTGRRGHLAGPFDGLGVA